MRAFTARFVLFDGFSNMVLSCLLEPLRAARDRAGLPMTWTLGDLDGAAVRSSSGLRVQSDPDRAAADRVDLLVVVAGYGFREHAGRRISRRLHRLVRNSGLTLAADTAPWLLARAGLLDGVAATLHWQILDEFNEAFPALQLSRDGYVRSERIWTCGGASTALDMMLALIGDRFGPALAFDVATTFVHDAERQATDRRGPGRLLGTGSASLRRVLQRMVDSLERPRTLAELANEAHLSPRTLQRLFIRELRMSPGRYYQSLRLARARELAVGTDLSQQQIALRCGYANAAALAKAYARHYGHPIGRAPRMWR